MWTGKKISSGLSHYISLMVIFVFGFLTIIGSGGDESDTGSAPVISSLNIYSSGPSLNVTLYFQDDDGDMSTITTAIYDGNGLLIIGGTDELEGSTDVKDGRLSGKFDFSNYDCGDYSIEFYFTDEKGNDSNIMSKSFQIEGGFGTDVNYTNETNDLFLRDTAIGDLNGDGLNDVAAIETGGYDEVYIYYQNVSSGLKSPVIIDPGISLSSIAIADMNNDDRRDLIVAGESTSPELYSGRILVMLQDTVTAELGSPQEYTVNSDDVYSIATGDINQDSRNDIAATIGDRIALFLQGDEGQLYPGVDIEASYRDTYCSHIKIADVNNDGNNDLITHYRYEGMAVFKQISPGEFGTEPDIYSYSGGNTYGYYSFPLSVGDVNGDGLTDIVTLYDILYTSYVDLFLQNSSGTLNDAEQVISDEDFYSLEIADITGDGLVDILIDTAGTIRLYRQTNDHSFSSDYESYHYSTHKYTMDNSYQRFFIGDITGDGRLDTVISFQDEGLYVLPYEINILIP